MVAVFSIPLKAFNSLHVGLKILISLSIDPCIFGRL